ncbi:MAG: RNA 3'-terminal phosphate cyclase [Acidobacteriota bacterium]
MLIIDGSFGEGGGQILRTSLALSLVTGKPFRIEKIRAGREKPGLMRQHLTAVNAATKIGCADVTGASIGSRELTFIPHNIEPGEYNFAVGTAGSATLVLQTVLPALLTVSGSSILTLEGGTHNPYAPPFDFLVKTFLPLINRLGVQVTAELLRPGFYPAGGGCFTVKIIPNTKLSSFDLRERGEITARYARAYVASLPSSIAQRELDFVAHKMSWDKSCLQLEEVKGSRGPGNIVMIEIASENLTEIFTGFGEKGVRAEAVAEQAVKAARRYLAANVPVGEYLADQLLLPMAMSGGGSFITLGLSRHATTNIDVLEKFLDIEINTTPVAKSAFLVELKKR